MSKPSSAFTESKATSLRLPKALHRQLRQKSLDMGIPMTDLVVQFIIQGLKAEEEALILPADTSSNQSATPSAL